MASSRAAPRAGQACSPALALAGRRRNSLNCGAIRRIVPCGAIAAEARHSPEALRRPCRERTDGPSQWRSGGGRLTAKGAQECPSDVLCSHGMPRHLRSDNGLELAPYRIRHWCSELGAHTLYIEPEIPLGNGYTGSSHSNLRDELLDREISCKPKDERVLIERWRNLNKPRQPRRSPGNLPQAPEAWPPSLGSCGPLPPLSDPRRMWYRSRAQINLPGMTRGVFGPWGAPCGGYSPADKPRNRRPERQKRLSPRG